MKMGRDDTNKARANKTGTQREAKILSRLANTQGKLSKVTAKEEKRGKKR